MNRRESILTSIGVLTPSMSAFAEKLKADAQQHGHYAVLGYSENVMSRKNTHPLFANMGTTEAQDLILRYGVRDFVSGNVYIKVATMPNARADAERVTTGGMMPVWNACVIAMCQNGKVQTVSKNRITAAADQRYDRQYVDRYLIPKSMHASTTPLLWIRTGIMKDERGSVEVLA